MVLILAGQPYEYPRRKPTDALNEFCDSVKKARSDSNKKITPLESREVKNINGGDADTLIVVQREFGAVNPSKAADTIGVPTKIGSVDATTCLILALTNTANGDVTVAHIDSEKQVDQGISNMLKLIGVASLDCKSAAPGTKPQDLIQQNGGKLPTVKVAMLGCVLYHEYSNVTLPYLLKKLIGTTDVAFDIGFGFDVAVWTLNYDEEKKNIRRRGLLVDTSKNVEGEILAIECQNENRTYPDARLRSLRSFAKDQSLSAITLFKGEEATLRITQAPAPAAATGAPKAIEAPPTAAATAASGEEKIRSVFKVVVRPFEWPLMLKDAAKKPLEWFYQLSSTPDMEPEDFANSVKQAVIFGNVYPADNVFPSKRPRLFAGNSETKKWVEL